MSSGKFLNVGRAGALDGQGRDGVDLEIAGVEEALAELDAGLSVPLEDVEAWIDSWDTPNELPMPQPRRRRP